MRIIKQTTQFKRDLKREAKGLHRLALQEDFIALIKMKMSRWLRSTAIMRSMVIGKSIGIAMSNRI